MRKKILPRECKLLWRPLQDFQGDSQQLMNTIFFFYIAGKKKKNPVHESFKASSEAGAGHSSDTNDYPKYTMPVK